jgi:ADP-ribosyl-[dinitrogen reductase] hydrolase
MTGFPDSITDRAIAAYLGLAIGDALGATVEFMTPREIQHQYGTHDKIIGGGWLGLKKGQVTDDTSMALALGDAILESDSVDATTIALRFDQWLRSKPVDVGNTVRRGIINFRSKGLTSVVASEDAGNGACMRLVPLALYTFGQTSANICESNRLQAHITHNNPLSDAACETVIRMIHDAFRGADKNSLLHGPVTMLREQHAQFNFRKRRMENPSGYIVDTMIAVFQAFFDTDTFRDCLVEVVNRGGDADTTGAIAGMIAGAYYGIDAVPGTWLKALDSEVRYRCSRQAMRILPMSPAFTETEDIE